MRLKCNLLFSLLEGVLIILALLVFIFLILPLFILPLILIYLYRWCLIKYVKSYRRDFVRIMADNSTVFQSDDLHKLPLCTLQGYAAYEGADVEDIIANLRNCMNGRDPVTNELLFPETHQFFERWMGYFWWKWEKDWNLDEHITIWEDFGSKSKDSLVEEKDLMEIMGFLETKPYKIGMSPWEAILIRNVVYNSKEQTSEIPKVVFIFRCHHGLADGFAMLNMFMRSMVTESLDIVPTTTFKQQSQLAETLYKSYALLRLPYESVRQGITSVDSNQWHLPRCKLTRKVIQGWTKRIPMQTIKELRTELGVGFVAVVVSCLAGAIRKMMLKRGVKVPGKMHALAPAPFPDRKAPLGNHWSGYMQELHTGEGDPIRRVQLQQGHNDRIKSSTILMANFFHVKLSNIFPAWIVQRAARPLHNSPTVIISNFPGPSKHCFSSGFPMTDMMFAGGALDGNIGIVMCIMSYNNGIRIVAGVDSAIFPTRQWMDEFIELIENEFHVLQEAIICDV